jgi:predicted aldo/keto reductase-like oxidoreductase
MEYVNLGSTGLKVSRICLGTMTYGSKKWREWVLEEEESRPFYRRAIEAGINFLTPRMCIRWASAKRSPGARSRSMGRRGTSW